MCKTQDGQVEQGLQEEEDPLVESWEDLLVALAILPARLRRKLVESWGQSLPNWSLFQYATDPALKERTFVWWWACKKTLTAKQQQILEKIADILDVRLMPYDGGSPERVEADRDLLNKDYREYDRLILKAWREGLGSHPFVFGRVDTFRAFGDREKLRCLERKYRHLKVGVESPIPITDMALLVAVDRLRSEGKSWPTIFRLVRNVGLLHKPSKELVELAKTIIQFLHEGRKWPDIVREIRALQQALPGGKQRHGCKESLRDWVTVSPSDKKRRSDKRHGYHYLYTKRLPPGLRKLVRDISPRGSEIRRVEPLEDDEDYNIAVVVPDGIPYDEVRQLEARLLRALAAYDYQESDKDHYPLTICRVWHERGWAEAPLEEGLALGMVEKLATQGATLQEALEQLHPALQVKKGSKKHPI